MVSKLNILWLALFAAFTLSAFSAQAAFAEGEWLANGAVMTSAQATDTIGTILIEDNSGLFKVDITCSVLLEGTVGPGQADQITGIVDLAGKDPMACTASTFCNSKSVSVSPIGLPWTTKVTLSGIIFLDIVTGGGYALICQTPLGTVEDRCTGNMSAELMNVTGGVESIFSEATSGLLNCTLGGAESGVISANETTKLNSGTLTVS